MDRARHPRSSCSTQKFPAPALTAKGQELPFFPCFHSKMMRGRCSCCRGRLPSLTGTIQGETGLLGQALGSSCQLRIPRGLTPVSQGDCQGEQGEQQESLPIWDAKAQFILPRYLEGSVHCKGRFPQGRRWEDSRAALKMVVMCGVGSVREVREGLRGFPLALWFFLERKIPLFLLIYPQQAALAGLRQGMDPRLVLAGMFCESQREKALLHCSRSALNPKGGHTRVLL